jgi:hypothetical protein
MIEIQSIKLPTHITFYASYNVSRASRPRQLWARLRERADGLMTVVQHFRSIVVFKTSQPWVSQLKTPPEAPIHSSRSMYVTDPDAPRPNGTAASQRPG